MAERPLCLNAVMPDPTTQPGDLFRTVVDHFETPLLRYAGRITGNFEQARDVVQDVFLRLHNLNGNRPDNLKAWLYTVCRRRALDVATKENRMKTLDDGTAAVCESPQAPQPAALVQQESEQHVIELLGCLPANQQEVVRLKFQHGLCYRDIAAVTGHSVSNVGFLLHTAIKKLREQLNPDS